MILTGRGCMKTNGVQQLWALYSKLTVWLTILYSVFCCLAVSSASAERALSNLKIVKNQLCTSLCDDMLSAAGPDRRRCSVRAWPGRADVAVAGSAGRHHCQPVSTCVTGNDSFHICKGWQGAAFESLRRQYSWWTGDFRRKRKSYRTTDTS